MATTDTSSCPAAEIQAIRPGDGAVADPTVTIQVAHDGACGVPPLLLLDADLVEVELEKRFLDRWVDLDPVDPLAEGTHTIATWREATGVVPLATFEVVAGAAPPPPPAAPVGLTLAAERSCEGALTTWMRVALAFEADPAGWGFVEVVFETEAGAQLTTEHLWYGQPTIEVNRGVFGGREACATALGSDVAGEAAWTSERVCAEPFEGCPEVAVAPDGGCGCGSAAGSGWALGLASIALLRRRR